METEKSKKYKTHMLRSISKQSAEFVESVLEKKRKGCGGKDLQKRKCLVTKNLHQFHYTYYLLSDVTCNSFIKMYSPVSEI